MLTKLTCRKFKCFGEVEIALGNPVVFIGPNNSGKTAALPFARRRGNSRKDRAEIFVLASHAGFRFFD